MVRVVPGVVALVPIRAYILDTHREHMERSKCSALVVSKLRSIRRCHINVSREPLRLAIRVQLSEIVIEATVLLQHEDNVVDLRDVASRRLWNRGRLWNR